MEFLKTYKNSIVICLILVIVSFYIGRFSKPAQVITETKEVVKTVTVKDENKNKVVYKEKIVYKDGTSKETEVTKEESSSKESSASESSKTAETKVTRDTGLSLAALAIVDSSDLKGHKDYGLHVQKRIVGNITIGAIATTDKKVGVSIGMEF